MSDPLRPEEYYLDPEAVAEGAMAMPQWVPSHVTEVDPFAEVKTEMGEITERIRTLLSSEHPVLAKVGRYFFEGDAAKGKKVRPALVLLMSRAVMGTVPQDVGENERFEAFDAKHGVERPRDSPPVPRVWESQRRLAEITELIHTASLLHDDVIDDSDMRRGAPAAHTVFGNKLAILGGDFLLARASISLARLRHVGVVELLSTVIEHLVQGEVLQMDPLLRDAATSNSRSADARILDLYYQKTYYKTGSLIANSCRGAAVLGACPPEIEAAALAYGNHIGMAFQLVDDALDFAGSTDSLGKPALADLALGIATAPVILSAAQHPELYPLMARRFSEPGDVDLALTRVHSGRGLEQTAALARHHAHSAIDALSVLPDSPARTALAALALRVVDRNR